MATKYLSAQSLNRRISIEENVPIQDSWGQPAENWAEIFKLWANVKMLPGISVAKSMLAGGTEVSRALGSIRIRTRSGINAGMRVKIGTSQIFDIKAVVPDETDRRYVDLVVEIGANKG